MMQGSENNLSAPSSILKSFISIKLKQSQSQGFALPMAFIFSLIMMTLMITSLIEAQSSRDSSETRQDAGINTIVADSAIARALVELSKPENSTLLVRNYDPINPETGRNYLGEDGMVESGDEQGTGVDQWTGYDPSALPCYQGDGISAPSPTLSGTIGTNATYQLLAYRYDPLTKEGKVLVEGSYQNLKSHVLLSISIIPDLSKFPGIGLIEPFNDAYSTGLIGLRGREILGNKGNIYFVPDGSPDPSLTGKSAPGSPDRDDYLNAIWSSTPDGTTADTVSGSIIACNLNINVPQGVTGTNFGVIDGTNELRGVGGTSPTLYRLEGIELSGTDVLTIDTTGGPVVIDMVQNIPGQRFSLRDSSKIINIRTDGQPPRVGDARIMIRHDLSVDLYDQTCMSQIFLYSFIDELLLLTDGPGCPSGKNTNFEGVAWVEAILSAKNDASNRDINYLGFGGSYNSTVITTGTTSGIAVPDDVSSLADLFQYADWPITYRYGRVKNWQRVRL